MAFIMPPIEKIHEAYSSIVDGRVTIANNQATVLSSDRTKSYLVTWNDNIYQSNDNGSYWVGYVGYPILAVLMLQGKLPYNENVASCFKGIKWKKLNMLHQNHYSEVVSLIMSNLSQKGINCDFINNEINTVYCKLQSLDISTKKSSILPPKERN